MLPNRARTFLLPAVVAAVYAAASGAYIYFSDHLIHIIAGGSEEAVLRLSVLKGWGFVGATSLGLFLLVWRLVRRSAELEGYRRQQLEESEQLRLLVEGTPHFFFYVQEADATISYISPSVEAITGRAVGAWLGQRHWFTTDNPINEQARKATRRHLAGEFDGTPVVVEVAHADGEPVLLETYEYSRFHEGVLIGLQGIAHDVTQRRRAEAALHESERALATLMSNLPGMAYRCQNLPDWPMEFVSRGSKELTGYAPEEIVMGGRVAYGDLIDPEDRDAVWSSVQAALGQRQPFKLLYRIHTVTGKVRWVWEMGQGVFGDDGALRSLEGFITDVTDRRRDETVRNALHRISESANAASRLDELLPEIHSIVAGLMPAGNFYIALWDAELGEIAFPYFVDENDPPPQPRPFGRGLTEYVLRTGQPLLASPDVFADLLRRGEVESHGTPSIDWLGVPLKVHDRTLGVLVVQTYTEGVRFSDEDKDLLRFVSAQVATSIERTRAEEALRESEQRFRALAETTPAAIVIIQDEAIVYANPVVEQIIGWRRNQVVGRRFADFVSPEHREMVVGRAQARLRGEDVPAQYEFKLIRRDGEERWVLASAGVLQLDREPGIVVTVFDITERRHAEEALRRSEARARAIYEAVPDLIFRLDRDGRFLDYKQSQSQDLLLSPANFLGREIEEVLPARVATGTRECLAKSLRTGSVCQFDYQLDIPGRGMQDFEARIVPCAENEVLAIVRNVTDQRRLEAQLRQSQKMEAVGRLAGGVAHDFNNLLQALLATLDSVQRSVHEPEKLQVSLAELEGHVHRGSAITRQLLLFARKDVSRLERCDLNAVVHSASTLLRRLVRENVRFETELSPEALVVHADRGQLEQVLVNLVVNAADAMPDGGDLSIRTERRGRDGRLLVRDCGHGMPDDVRAVMFEPFFTTKEVGRGTGLGLSVVQGIVANLGGCIEVDSRVGDGTTVMVTIPLQHEDFFSLPLAAAADWVPAPGVGERILLVEDEAAVRESLQQSLEMMGYAVCAAETAEDAEKISLDGRFDLLLTDLMLPGINGGELAERLRARSPRLNVVIMSGYARDGISESLLVGENVHFLQKPFDMLTLARTVSTALGKLSGPE